LRVGLSFSLAFLILAVAIFYVTRRRFPRPQYASNLLPEVPASPSALRFASTASKSATSKRSPRSSPNRQAPDRMHNIEVDIRMTPDIKVTFSPIQPALSSPKASSAIVTQRPARLHRRPLKKARPFPVRGKSHQEVVERSADVLANLKALSERDQDIVATSTQAKVPSANFSTTIRPTITSTAFSPKATRIVGNVQSGQGTPQNPDER